MKHKGHYSDEEKKNESLEGYRHCIGSINQALNFEVTTNYVSHTQENFNNSRDVAESLRVLSPSHAHSWRPRVQESEAEDESARDR